MRTLVLIDAHALIHRAFHALPPLHAKDGQQTNAVYGFTSVLLKMLTDLKPDYVAAAFDLAAPTFRHEAYEEYKAHREKAPDELYEQIPLVKDMLKAFGIPLFEQEGYEADDIIGTIERQMRTTDDLQTIIMTGDLDTLQLVHADKTVVFTLRKGVTDTILYNEKAVEERYGLTPEQIPDFKGLTGDPSDNIPGVSGVGQKTASSLLQQFGTLEKLFETLEKTTAIEKKKGGLTERLRTKLLEQKDTALFSKKLATIITDVPLTFDLETADWRNQRDPEALDALCQQLGFASLAKRIPAALGDAAPEPATEKPPKEAPEAPSIPVITVDKLPKGDVIAIEPLWKAETRELESLLLTVDGKTPYRITAPNSKDLRTLCTTYPQIIGHDLKPILRTVDLGDLKTPTWFDTMIAAWLVRPDMRDYSLEYVYRDIVNQELGEGSHDRLEAVWQLKPLLENLLEAGEASSLLKDIEMPLLPVLATMERRGIRVDRETIDHLLTTSSEAITDLEKKIYKLAGGPFNINSPSQLGEVLFTKLALRGKVRKTSGGAPSTAAAELEKLRDEHPIIEHILHYRELAKLKTTYIEPFPDLIADDGRIHTTYHQTGTATGRLSSSNPNLQNIPTRTELGQQFRAAFVADPDWSLLSFDYSQLELRVVAHIAEDATMIEAFQKGEDIHTRTASEVFGLAPGQVTKDMRRRAKVLNFGMIYGMGPLGFARAANISRDAAKQFIDEYFARFPGIARYMERTKQEAYDKGFVQTLFGRRRPLPDIKSQFPQLIAAAERMAINHPIQGTAADLVKFAMLRVHDELQSGSFREKARMLLQVHDELVIEAHPDILEEVVQHITDRMEHVHTLSVPLIVDARTGTDWSHMKLLARDE